MKILVTGARGFVGKNLIAALRAKGSHDIFEFDIDTEPILLDEYTRECDVVFHLAGVNRARDSREFMQGNFGFTFVLLECLKKNSNKAPVISTSSIQAMYDNPYGISKKAGEDLLFRYCEETGVSVYVYRLPNIFGKWCKPNYNSAVTTFCNNIANDLPITVHDRNVMMSLVYIDDVLDEFMNALEGKPNKKGDYCSVPIVHTQRLGDIVSLLYSFKASRDERSIPHLRDAFTKKLYSTYLSYLPKHQFSYPLKMNIDSRGSFTEILKALDWGQFSVNISKPGVTKGDHWHNTKNEKFVVVSGKGVIRFRKIASAEVIEYVVDGDKMEVVDIPPGYTHHIENLGKTDLVTFMWANEVFNPEKPDTYFLKV